MITEVVGARGLAVSNAEIDGTTTCHVDNEGVWNNTLAIQRHVATPGISCNTHQLTNVPDGVTNSRFV